MCIMYMCMRALLENIIFLFSKYIVNTAVKYMQVRYGRMNAGENSEIACVF